MPTYSQLNSPIAVTTPLGPDVLLLTGFRGSEAISDLFRFELDLQADNANAVPFAKVLGQPITVRTKLLDGTVRYFNGIVRRFRQKHRDKFFTYFQAEMVPRFWVCTRSVQSRIFQQQTVPAILKAVLQGPVADVSYQLTGTYKPRDFCVQYQETDFAFASRLMEEEGIFYYHKHTDGKHELVISDNSAAGPVLAAEGTARFDTVEGGTRDAPRVQVWEKCQEVRANQCLLWDYSFELPDKKLDATTKIADSVQVGTVSHSLRPIADTLERYEYPAGYARWYDGVASGGTDQPADLQNIFQDNQRMAQLRMAEEAAGSLAIEGQGTCGQFQPGQKFTLQGHFDGDGTYVLTRVEHEAKWTGDFRSGDTTAAMNYGNRFTCLPEALPYRPARGTPRPKIAGTQTATVVGPAASDVFVDKYGRVKVQFHWDRQGKSDINSSTWLRVAQIWAGNRWGAFFWPRVGHEVVVAFEEGDPDQPLIVGSVYNANNMPPFALPTGVSASGIKSCSLGGEPAHDYNWLVFHDAPDDEHVHIHSENHGVITSEASRHQHTPGPSIEVMGASPFAAAGSGGGGGAFAIGSGSGGGLLDILDLSNAIGGHDSPSWLKNFGHAFPGSANFVWGSVISSSFLGDQVKHALLGANVTLTCDPEGIMWDNIDTLAGGALHGIALGAAGATTALLAGVGGNFGMTLGPNTSLTYFASNLGVTRGESYQFKAPTLSDDWTPVGIGVKALTFLIAGGAIASDVCGHVYSSASSEGHEWATLCSRIFVQRFMGVLRFLEEENAIVEAAAAKAKEAEAKAAESAKLIATIQSETVKLATPLVDAAAKKSQTAINLAQRGVALLTSRADTLSVAVTKLEMDVARTDKVFQGDYSITARDVTLVSTSAGQKPPADLEPTVLNISSRGGGDNGAVSISGTHQVTMSAVPALGVGGPVVGVLVTPDHGSISLTNTGPGYLTLTQGVVDVGAKIGLTTFPPLPPEIAMSVGPPDIGSALKMTPTGMALSVGPPAADGITLSVGAPGVGASLSLKPEGVTLKFAAWSLTMNTSGITLTAGPNSLKVGPGAIELNGLSIKLTAQLESEQQAVSLKLTASALQQVQGALSQMK